MKKRFLLGLFAVILLLCDMQVNAQRNRRGFHSARPSIVYRTRPRISVGIGGFFGGFYGPRFYGYGPSVGFNIGVVLPPPGTIVRGLPPGTVRRTYGGVNYYYRSNTYYREREDGGYEIVSAPLGASLDKLPIGSKPRKIDGSYFYEHNGIFYKLEKDDNGRIQYIIVGKNGELRMQEADEMRGDKISNDGEYEDDSNDEDYDAAPIVKNGNVEEGSPSETATGNSVWPEVGDRFDNLPRNSRSITVNGENLYISPNGIYYKEVTEDGNTVYEVIKTK